VISGREITWMNTKFKRYQPSYILALSRDYINIFLKQEKKMKKFLTLLLAPAMVIGLAACAAPAAPKTTEVASEKNAETEAESKNSEVSPASSEAKADKEPEEIIVFAAASMTETINKIKDLYEKDHQVRISCNFDSSGTLKTQIQEHADCDLFISAGQKQMNQLDKSVDKEKNPDQLDFVAEGTRINLLENKVVLVVPKDNPKCLKSFDDLASKFKEGSVLLAMGNSDVPVGQYTQKILAYYKLDEEALAKAGSITYGTNVKEVTTQVAEGSVDCGVVYCTDAFSAGLTVIDNATSEMCGQVIYPAAVMKNAKHAEAAKAFLDYLQGQEAMDIFKAVGFSPVN